MTIIVGIVGIALALAGRTDPGLVLIATAIAFVGDQVGIARRRILARPADPGDPFKVQS